MASGYDAVAQLGGWTAKLLNPHKISIVILQERLFFRSGIPIQRSEERGAGDSIANGQGWR